MCIVPLKNCSYKMVIDLNSLDGVYNYTIILMGHNDAPGKL